MIEVWVVAIVSKTTPDIRRPDIWPVTGPYVGVALVDYHIATIVNVDIALAAVYVSVVGISIGCPIIGITSVTSVCIPVRGAVPVSFLDIGSSV